MLVKDQAWIRPPYNRYGETASGHQHLGARRPVALYAYNLERADLALNVGYVSTYSILVTVTASSSGCNGYN